MKLVDNASIPFDRSRITAAEHCMRLRYWGYEHEGTGLEGEGQWFDPLIGTAVHNGVEALLQGKPIEQAVALGRETLLEAQRNESITLFRAGPDPQADFEEGMLLAEALIRGWHKTRFPVLNRDWDIIDIEREMTATYTYQGRQLIQLTRPDLVMRRKADGAIFVRNLKTTSRVDQKWREKWQYDMSTFSEALAVEQFMGVQVAGTIMEGLVKGSRKDYPEGSGNYHYTSPLLWAWKHSGEPPMTDDRWYGRYEWTCTAPHQMSRGKDCPGGRNHKLSGVHKDRTDNFPGGIRGWIDYLAASDLPLLEEQFVELTPILRSPYEIERWKRQALPRELSIRMNRDYIAKLALDDPAKEYLLDHFFPMSTAEGNCVWPSRCQFFDLCHGTARDDLAGHGFRQRNPNHPGEFSPEGAINENE